MMQSKLSDSELIEQTLAGNQSAYADLVKRHQRFVFTLAMRFAKRREDAEEYRIYYGHDFLTKKKIDTDSMDDENTYIQVANQSSGYDVNSAENKSRSYYLNQAIEQLLPDDATIITLFYKGEQSLEEIGQAMGMEANTVKVKLFRARQRLKEKLERNLKYEVKELI